MMQWVRRGRMLRLTWRTERGERTASVSLVDGRVLDGWGGGRIDRPDHRRRTRKLPSRVLQQIVPHHRSLVPQCSSRVRTRVLIGAPPPPRPRPVTSRTIAAGARLRWARRNRSALATASSTV